MTRIAKDDVKMSLYELARHIERIADRADGPESFRPLIRLSDVDVAILRRASESLDFLDFYGAPAFVRDQAKKREFQKQKIEDWRKKKREGAMQGNG